MHRHRKRICDLIRQLRADYCTRYDVEKGKREMVKEGRKKEGIRRRMAA